VSGVVNQQRHAEHFDGSPALESRVTPVVPASQWSSDVGDEPAAANGAFDESDENEFWDTPPRYSQTVIASLAPAPITHAPSRWHTLSARLLFATIACAIIVLLGLELKSLSERAPLTSARALDVLVSTSSR